MQAERSTQQEPPSGAGSKRVLRRYSVQERERLIGEFEAGGQSRKAFCAQRGVNLTTFHGWLQKRSRRGGKKPRKAAMSFAEVKLPATGAVPIEVLLPNGARVQIGHRGPAEELVKLIRGVAGYRQERHKC